ncbi:MAG: helix-turn-helix domain-containing protein [Planctomycetota bacterium]|jgi:DNA-binding transcriptional regulator YiaG
MSTFVSALKQEVSRLARKEVRAQLEPMKKASARHRSEIAELKRLVGQLTKRVVDLERQVKRQSSTRPGRNGNSAMVVKGTGNDGQGPRRRFSPAWLRDHRQRVGMSAAEYARLIGVSTLTIYNWEHEKTRPRAAQVEVIAEVRQLGKREARRKLETIVDGT